MIVPRKYPWVAKQTWKHIFFLHWRIEPEHLIPFIPPPLKIDLFDRSAWISIVCFVAKNSHLRYISTIDVVQKAIQINIRTYVRLNGDAEAGVYFFRLLADHKLAALGANTMFNLPFHYTKTTMQRNHDVYNYFTSQDGVVKLHVELQPSADYDESSLANFLTERYCIWNFKGNRLIKIPIIHPKWTLRKSHGSIIENNVHPLITEKTPSCIHYFDKKVTKLYPYESVALLGQH